MRRHFISEELWFGVGNPSLDLVSGAFRRTSEAKRCATARNLHPGA